MDNYVRKIISDNINARNKQFHTIDPKYFQNHDIDKQFFFNTTYQPSQEQIQFLKPLKQSSNSQPSLKPYTAQKQANNYAEQKNFKENQQNKNLNRSTNQLNSIELSEQNKSQFCGLQKKNVMNKKYQFYKQRMTERLQFNIKQLALPNVREKQLAQIKNQQNSSQILNQTQATQASFPDIKFEEESLCNYEKQPSPNVVEKQSYQPAKTDIIFHIPQHKNQQRSQSPPQIIQKLLKVQDFTEQSKNFDFPVQKSQINNNQNPRYMPKKLMVIHKNVQNYSCENLINKNQKIFPDILFNQQKAQEKSYQNKTSARFFQTSKYENGRLDISRYLWSSGKYVFKDGRKKSMTIT